MARLVCQNVMYTSLFHVLLYTMAKTDGVLALYLNVSTYVYEFSHCIEASGSVMFFLNTYLFD